MNLKSLFNLYFENVDVTIYLLKQNYYVNNTSYFDTIKKLNL